TGGGRQARHRHEPDRRRRDPQARRPHGGDAEGGDRALQRHLGGEVGRERERTAHAASANLVIKPSPLAGEGCSDLPGDSNGGGVALFVPLTHSSLLRPRAALSRKGRGLCIEHRLRGTTSRYTFSRILSCLRKW